MERPQKATKLPKSNEIAPATVGICALCRPIALYAIRAFIALFRPLGSIRAFIALFRPSGSIRAHSYGYVLAAIGGLRAYASAAPRLPRWGKPLRKRPKRRSSFDFVRNGEIAQNSTVCPSRNGHITAQIGNIAHFHQRHFQP